MKSFFELSVDHQADKIMEVIRERKLTRKPQLTINKNDNWDSFVQLSDQLREIKKKENPIPVQENTRFRFLKRVIGKAIRPFTWKQFMFNQSLTAYLEFLINHLRKIDGENKQFIEEKNGFIPEKNELIAEKVKLLDGEIIRHSNILKQLETNDELNNNSKVDKAETEHLRKWIEGVEQLHQNTNNWLQLVSERTEQVEKYQEKLRKELFAEMKYYKMFGQDSEKKDESSIINQEKYQAMLQGNGIKVNLGCGTLSESEYLNVDIRELEGVDVVADARRLPFQERSVSELYLSHIIEHFPEVEMEHHILPHWFSLLSKGGKIRIICPNWEAMLAGYGRGEISFDVLKEVTFGSQEYEGNMHYNMFTPETLSQMLERVGFSNIQIVDRERKNGLCLEMEIEGERL